MNESTAHQVELAPPGWKEHISKVFASAHSDADLPPHICFVCGELQGKNGGSLMKCGSCHTGRYCSKQCQKKYWKYHKPQCQMLKELEEAERFESKVSLEVPLSKV